MFALASSIRVPWAAAGRKCAEVRVLRTAVFAGVFALFRAFVEFVLSFAGAIGVPKAGASSQGPYRIIRSAAIFTIKLCHQNVNLWF